VTRMQRVARGGLVVGALGAFVAVGIEPSTFATDLLDVSQTFGAASAGWLALLASGRPGNEGCRRAFRLIGLGFVSWALGNVVWSAYEIPTGSPPGVSAADVGFLGCMTLLGAGVLAWPRVPRTQRSGDPFEAVAFVVLAVMTSAAFVIAPLLERGVHGWGGIVAFAYPLFDLVVASLVLAALVLARSLERGRLSVVAVGLLALVAGDTHYALAGSAYVTGSVFDVGWTLGFVCTGIAALLPPGWHERRTRSLPAAGLLLSISAAAFVVYELVERWSLEGPAELLEFAALGGVLVLLVTRYWAVARRRTRESHVHRALAAVTEPALADLEERELAAQALGHVVGELDLGAGAIVSGEAVLASVGLSDEDLRRPGLVTIPLLDGDDGLGMLVVAGLDTPAARAVLEQLAGRIARQLALSRARTALARAYAEREATLEASRTGVCLVAADGGTAFSNSAWTALLGAELEEAGSWDALRAARGDRFWSADGKFLSTSSIAVADGRTLLSVDDVSDAARERESRGRLLAEIMVAQERESRRVAELLHDDAVQQLTALSLRLELEAQRSGDESTASFADAAREVTRSLRRLLAELNPNVLESRGLAAAAEAAAETLRGQGVEVSIRGRAPRLVPDLERLAYRVLQEALDNVLKHASATAVQIVFSASRGTFRCRVDDDGVGSDPRAEERALGAGRLGLHLVRERLGLAGGRLLLRSRGSGGTSFTFELPDERRGDVAAPAEVQQ
jgi:signal transduction histidine kinase